jgi:cystathionine beta-lyase
MLHRTVDSLENRGQAYTYGRRLTPTIEALQEAICELEGGAGTVLCPSGLQACTLAILSTVSAGDHLLVTDSVYGPTRTFCDKTLARFGVTTTYYDPLIGGGIEKLFRPNTKAIFTESPGSLTFEIQDIPAIVECAHANNIAVILDNTWGTPLLFDAFSHGVDLSVMAATKYIVGHSDALMGTVTANDRYLKQLCDTHGNLGLCVGPDDVYLTQRGLRPARGPCRAAGRRLFRRRGPADPRGLCPSARFALRRVSVLRGPFGGRMPRHLAQVETHLSLEEAWRRMSDHLPLVAELELV